VDDEPLLLVERLAVVNAAPEIGVARVPDGKDAAPGTSCPSRRMSAGK
jgi:hypothetical protein